MNPASRPPSSTRAWWLLLAAGVAFVVGITLLDDLLREEPATSAPSGDRRGVSSPGLPQVRRLEDGAVEIRHDFFRRTTIRLDDEEASAALYRCLEDGIDKAFGDGIEGRTHARLRDETRKILDHCLLLHGESRPTPPRHE